MPSPVGHALAGLLVAAALAPPPGGGAPAVAWRGGSLAAAALLGVAAGIAPDLDFVPGLLVGDSGRFHHGPSHSLGAALAAGLGVAVLVRLVEGRSARPDRLRPVGAGVLVSLAWALHCLLDVLAVDTSAPYGAMLWWPLSDHYVISPWPIFTDIQRRDAALAGFVASLASWHNLLAVLLEVLLLGPPLLLVLRLRRWTPGRRPAGVERRPVG